MLAQLTLFISYFILLLFPCPLQEGFPITSLREINTLLLSKHENIVNVLEIVVGNTIDEFYIVMEFVEHDLKNLMSVMKHPFTLSETKTIMLQLASSPLLEF